MATMTFIRYRTQSAGALNSVIQYVAQDKKTMDDETQLLSGQNCTPQFAQREFLATRAAYRKDSPIYFYHYVQSFSPEERITGVQAHEIAKGFAAKAWPENEVLIATHVDAAHIHSHFLVNSVCFETGRMLRQGPKTLERLRNISDELCREQGLSVVIPQPDAPRRMSAREYRSADKGESWKLRLAIHIDDAMKIAGSKEMFVYLMECEGYQVHWTDDRKYITYTTRDGKRCRDDRLHEPKYRKEKLELEFRIRQKIYGGLEGGPAQEHGGSGASGHRRDGDGDQLECVGGNTEDAKRAVGQASHSVGFPGDKGGYHRVSGAADGKSGVPHRGDQESDGGFSGGATGNSTDGRCKPDGSGFGCREESVRGDGKHGIEDAGDDDADGCTGWEAEREIFAELIAGERKDAKRQEDFLPALSHPKPDFHFDGTDAARLAAALSRLSEDEGEDEEERRKRIQAEQNAANLGAVLGLAIGAAAVLADDRTPQQDERITGPMEL